MNDLVERLRELSTLVAIVSEAVLLAEAADEIERLCGELDAEQVARSGYADAFRRQRDRAEAAEILVGELCRSLEGAREAIELLSDELAGQPDHSIQLAAMAQIHRRGIAALLTRTRQTGESDVLPAPPELDHD